MEYNQETKKSIEQHNTLSFHLLRSKFQSSHHPMKKDSHSISTNPIYNQTLSKRFVGSRKKLNKQLISNPQPIDDQQQQLFPLLKRNNTASSIDIHSTPSLWSSSNSSSTNEESDIEEITISKTVPRTGSFANELSQRLAQSERKGESINHMIPSSASLLTIHSRKSAPPTHHPFDEPLAHLPTTHYNSRKSVPNSTSSPSLIKRSTTITSLSSYESTSSSYQTTKTWTPVWLQPPEPSPTEIPVLTRSSAVKRSKVIQELLNTERNYQADMKLIQEIYYDTAHEVLSKLEMKGIFINLLEILEFEQEFLELLERACEKDDYQQQDSQMTVGVAFNTVMSKLEHIYGDYCKKHEDALNKIQEISQRESIKTYFLTCQEKMKGRTTCWDLASLLIKPVQRVLKYPLLLKEIVALTPEFHLDYDQLAIATLEIQKVADHINEIKKRKDLVEQLIHHDKKKLDKNVVQGINKRFTRRVHKKKHLQQQGVSEILFEDIYKQFEVKHDLALQLMKEVEYWIQKIKESNSSLTDLVDSLEEVYGDSDGIGLRSIAAFKKLASQLSSFPLESAIEENVYHRIYSCLKLFKNPSNVIEKRNRKLIDYNRCHYIVTVEGKIPDKQLQASTEAYISLNAHLLDELPVFLSLIDQYFDVILEEFSKIQSSYYNYVTSEWKTLTNQVHRKSWGEIEDEYEQHIKKIEWRMNEIYTVVSREKMFTSSTLIDNTTLDETSLFSDPLFECVALMDYAKEKLSVNKDDIIQIWLTSNQDQEEWYYCSVKGFQDYGWIPSHLCTTSL